MCAARDAEVQVEGFSTVFVFLAFFVVCTWELISGRGEFLKSRWLRPPFKLQAFASSHRAPCIRV